MDQYRSRLKLSESFERHWSIRISGEIHMDQSLVHTFSWGNSYGPMVLKVLLKFPPTLVLVHGWLFPVLTYFWPPLRISRKPTFDLRGLKNANAKRRVFWTQRTWTQALAPREVFKSQKAIAMRFLNASVLERKSLNRNLSWGFPLGNLLPKTRVLKHRVLECKRRPNANASVLGTQRFRTLSFWPIFRLLWFLGGLGASRGPPPHKSLVAHDCGYPLSRYTCQRKPPNAIVGLGKTA